MDTEISIFSVKCYHFVCMSMENALSSNANNKISFIFLNRCGELALTMDQTINFECEIFTISSNICLKTVLKH